MKKKTAPKTRRKALLHRDDGSFDSAEFMLLAFITVALMVILAGQFHLLPNLGLTPSVLGTFSQK